MNSNFVNLNLVLVWHYHCILPVVYLYLVISTAAIISIKYRFCLSFRCRNKKKPSDKLTGTVGNRFVSDKQNLLCFYTLGRILGDNYL